MPDETVLIFTAVTASIFNKNYHLHDDQSSDDGKWELPKRRSYLIYHKRRGISDITGLHVGLTTEKGLLHMKVKTNMCTVPLFQQVRY